MRGRRLVRNDGAKSLSQRGEIIGRWVSGLGLGQAGAVGWGDNPGKCKIGGQARVRRIGANSS